MDLQLGDMELTNLERERYKKHLQLDAIGEEGQIKLKRASVLVVGAGGLGSPVLMYLAAAGIGNITIVDDDRVSLSNLQRQVIHTTPMIDALKVESARERLHLMNPEVNITIISARLDTANAERIAAAQQVVVDCTDNLETSSFSMNAVPGWAFHSFLAQYSDMRDRSRCLMPRTVRGLPASCRKNLIPGRYPALNHMDCWGQCPE